MYLQMLCYRYFRLLNVVMNHDGSFCVVDDVNIRIEYQYVSNFESV